MYDGAIVMSGSMNGIQALFRREIPQIVYVRCYNQQLNLITSDVCKNIANVKMFFGVFESLYVFISGFSAYSKFSSVQKAMNYK